MNKISYTQVFWKLLRFISPYRKLAFKSTLLLLIIIGIDLVLPQIQGGVINYLSDMLRYHAGESIILWPFLAGYMGLIVISSIVRFHHVFMRSKMIQGILKDIRCTLYNAIQRLSFSYHDRTNTGQLISRVTHDVSHVREFFGSAIFMAISLFVYLFGSAILMSMIHVKLTLVAFSTFPVTIFLIIIFSKKMPDMWRTTSEHYGNLTTVLQENISGVRVVKAFAKEDFEIKKFSEKTNIFLNQLYNTVYYWSSRIPLAQLIFSLSMPFVLWYGGVLVINNQINIGGIAKFIFYLLAIGGRMNYLRQIISIINRASASGSRIFEILEEAQKVKTKKDSVPIPDGKGRVVFEKVCFGYNRDNQVLKDINLEVNPGEMIALIGHTGSGKTTLVNLIPRFYDVGSGRILIDGIDIRNITLDSLRNSISIVFQETFLFSTTIAENIAFGKPNVSMKDIERCARITQAHQFIMEFKNGYDTITGERGVTLSGGQKQRIAIARAILMDSRILILDNATSSVDSETERLIYESLLEMASHKTIFIISQKISTITNAHKITVVDKGEIAETGTHEQLMLQNGLYKKIYNSQFTEEEIISSS